MEKLPEFQQTQYAFAAHLRKPEVNPAPAGIEDRRMKIYRDLIYNNIESFIVSGFPVLRSLVDDADWHQLVRDFVSRHQSHTPYFLEISQEFLRYLQEECGCLPANLPFALELAHYEWVELALDVSAEKIPAQQVDDVNLLEGRPVVSPVAWRLSYQYPVHRISRDFRPESPSEQPTCLVVYRNRENKVSFMEVNAVTVRVLQLLEEEDVESGKAALLQIAEELGNADPTPIISFGAELLEQLWQQDILVSCR